MSSKKKKKTKIINIKEQNQNVANNVCNLGQTCLLLINTICLQKHDPKACWLGVIFAGKKAN